MQNMMEDVLAGGQSVGWILNPRPAPKFMFFHTGVMCKTCIFYSNLHGLLELRGGQNC